MKKNHLLQIILVGDTKSGKSTLLSKFLISDCIIDSNYIPTIGIICANTIRKYKSHNITYHIVDTSGQDQFRCQVSSYYKTSKIIIIVVDLCNRESFENLDWWLCQIVQYAPISSFKIIVGTKNDLVNHIKISSNEISIFCKDHNIKYVEIINKKQNKISLYIEPLMKLFTSGSKFISSPKFISANSDLYKFSAEQLLQYITESALKIDFKIPNKLENYSF